MSKKLSLLLLFTALAFIGTSTLNSQTIEKQVIGSGGFLGAKNSNNVDMSGIVGQVAIFRTSGLYNSKTLDVFQGFWVPKDQLTIGVEDPYPSNTANATNFPNPFINQTTIRYELPAPAIVQLKVYDLMGNQIKILYDGFQDAGIQNVTWNAKDELGTDVSSGSYVYEVTARPAGGSNFETFKVKNMMIIAK